MHFEGAVVAHTFNPSTWEAEAGGSLEFEARLVYRVSSRTAGGTWRNPISKTLPSKMHFAHIHLLPSPPRSTVLFIQLHVLPPPPFLNPFSLVCATNTLKCGHYLEH